ncbi:MAG: 4Fe-4S binding protein [Sedimentisphaerales bacterium]|nr:4Fe-4S binding protein [Sedimentisphaerales bacterium]
MLRSVFKRLGPTWLSTPGRRCIQTFCLILFLVLFFFFSRPYVYDDGTEEIPQIPDVEIFLLLDPLVSISAALASRALVWSLAAAGVVLLIGIVIPRWFCGYVCPMGTLIDLFDWGVGRHISRFRLRRRGWWVNLRFYFLLFTLIAAACGVSLSGFLAAIPVVTRGMLYIFSPLRTGLTKGWDFVPQMNAGQYISIFLFLGVPALGLLRPRFWCAYLCPSGALFSLAGAMRLRRRKVEATCIKCGRCLDVCPFDAIGPDFSGYFINCAICRTCKGVCPKQSIKFVGRRNQINLKPPTRQSAVSTSVSRRRFLIGTIGVVGAGTVAGAALTAERRSYAESYPVRPPGSLPESKFRRQCVRCGECINICPSNVLQPAGFELGIDGLWTPKVVADRSGCLSFCNNCGRVCPTGAIRELSLEEKRAARIGLAVVNKNTCLPYARRDNCGLCVGECASAGYNAIEFVRIGGITDESGAPVQDSGYLAPVVLEDKCVGCGLCRARCYAANVKEKKLLGESAIDIFAGPGKEDRIVSGSYITLQKQRVNPVEQQKSETTENTYLPDFLR